MHTKIFTRSVGSSVLLVAFIATIFISLLFMVNPSVYAAQPCTQNPTDPNCTGGTTIPCPTPNNQNGSLCDADWADGQTIAVNLVIPRELKEGNIDNTYNLTPANFKASTTPSGNDMTLTSTATPVDADPTGAANGSPDIDTSKCSPMILQVNNYKTATSGTLKVPHIILNPNNLQTGQTFAMCSGYESKLININFGNTWTLATVGGTTNPGSPNPSPNPTPNSNPQCQDDCPLGCDEGLRWAWCDILGIINTSVQQLNSWIGLILYIPVQEIFTPTFQSVFDIFRNLGVALLVIAGLVMVISQAADLEIFAAYTVRKALPRIIIAAIAISLSWQLLEFTITLFNDLGDWTGKIILSTAGLHGATVGGIIWGAAFTGLLASIFTVAVIGSLTIGGVGALLLSALVLLFTSVMVLLLREIIVLICILVAPLAIASYVLPGTEKLWRFWRETLLTTLLMYPIIMAFISAGATLAYITASVKGNFLLNVLAVMMYFAPYIMLPFAFKLAGGLMSQVISLAQDQHHKSIESRLAAYRQGEREWLHEQRMGEKTRLGSSRLGGIYRRVATRGGIFGGERYRQFDQKRRAANAARALEEDAGFASGDDLANTLALEAGMTRDNFLRRYAAGVQDAAARQGRTVPGDQQANALARTALGALEASYGARIGTNAMRVTAFQARTASVTGYNGDDEGLRELVNNSGQLVADRLITTTQAAAAIKANKARADQSGMSFGGLMNEIGDTAATIDRNRTTGTNNVTVSDDAIRRLRQSALDGTQPGALIGARREAVTALAPAIRDNLVAAYHNLGQAQQGNDQAAITTAQAAVDGQLAHIAGIYDVMSQVAPQNARAFADEVMGVSINIPGPARPMIGANGQQVVGPNGAGIMQPGPPAQTIQALVEQARQQPRFIELRREYGSSYAAYQNQQAQQGMQGPQTGNHIGQPPMIGPRP